MRRAARRRLILLAFALALLALVVWQLQRDAHAEAGALTALDPATITHIALILPGTPTRHFEKRQGHWWHVDGTPARALDGRLDGLADTAAARVLSWRPASDFDPARIGLSPPQATLQLDGLTLEFGEISVTGPQHYVRVGQRVALVPARYMPRSPSAPTVELH